MSHEPLGLPGGFFQLFWRGGRVKKDERMLLLKNKRRFYNEWVCDFGNLCSGNDHCNTNIYQKGKQLGMKPEEIFRLSDFSKEDFLNMMTKGVTGFSKAEYVTKI